MVHRQFQREGFGQLADEIVCRWLVAVPELFQCRTVQKGGVPDPVRNLYPKKLLLQETGQRGGIGKIHAYYYTLDGEPLTEDEATNADGTLRPNTRMHVPTFMTDSAGNVFTDALGEPLSPHYGRPGYIYQDGRDIANRELNRDLRNAELSNAWKGGLQEGDNVTMGDRRMEVVGHNVDTGKTILADTAELDTDELKRAVYEDGVQAMNDAWRTRSTDNEPGGACVTSEGAQGKWVRGKDGA